MNHFFKRFFLIFFFAFTTIISLSALMPTSAYAETNEHKYVDNQSQVPVGIISEIKSSVETANKKLVVAAKKILYTMLLISIVLLGYKCISGGDFHALFIELGKFFIIAGALYGIVENTDYIIKIIESIPSIVLDAKDTSNPESKIMKVLLDLVEQVGAVIEATNWKMKIPVAIVGLSAIALVTIILINYIIILLKMYFVINIGVIAVGLGGCSINNRYAMNYLKEAISYSLQLLAMMMIIVTLSTYIQNFIQNSTMAKDVSSLLPCIMLTIVVSIFAVLSISIPNSISQLIDGFGHNSISPIAAAKVGGKMAGAAAPAVTQAAKAGAKGALTVAAGGMKAAATVGSMPFKSKEENAATMKSLGKKISDFANVTKGVMNDTKKAMSETKSSFMSKTMSAAQNIKSNMDNTKKAATTMKQGFMEGFNSSKLKSNSGSEQQQGKSNNSDNKSNSPSANSNQNNEKAAHAQANNKSNNSDSTSNSNSSSANSNQNNKAAQAQTNQAPKQNTSKTPKEKR